jgi:hypothetical protein
MQATKRCDCRNYRLCGDEEICHDCYNKNPEPVFRSSPLFFQNTKPMLYRCRHLEMVESKLSPLSSLLDLQVHDILH